MPPRKPRASTARATRSTQRKTRAELDIKSEERDSPDPIGSTPVPGPSHSSDLGDILASSSRARSRLSHRSSPASSTHAPSSESRPGREVGTKAKTRLRSGRRSKGFKEVAVLGEGDLIVPSDEEEYEEWVEGKRGESSKMAQERWERERDPTRSHGQSRGMDPEEGGLLRDQRELRVFVPLFSPLKAQAQAQSPPLESQPASGAMSGYTTSTAPMSRKNSVDDPFSISDDGGAVLGSSRYDTSSISIDKMAASIPDESSGGAEHASGADTIEGHERQILVPEGRDASQTSVPRSTLSVVPPRGPAMEDLYGLDDVEMIALDESEGIVADIDREPTASPRAASPSTMGMIEDEPFSVPALRDISPSRSGSHRGNRSVSPGREDRVDKREPDSYMPPTDLPRIAVQSKEEAESIRHPDSPGRTTPEAQASPTRTLAGSSERGQIATKPEAEGIKPNLTLPPFTPTRSAFAAGPSASQAPNTGSTNVPFFTPSIAGSGHEAQITQDSPLVESQLGLVGHSFGMMTPSPARSGGVEGTSIPPSSMPLDHATGSPSTPRPLSAGRLAGTRSPWVPDMGAGVLPTPPVGTPAMQNLSPSSPDAIDAFRSQSPLSPLPDDVATLAPLPIQVPPLVESIPPIDPALERFRGARSFRTRTTLQLQPYTRERLLYEAALRKGGLKKGKRAIGTPREISQPDDGDEAYEQDEPRSTADRTDPEAIVIRPSPPPRPKTPVQIIEADYDEYNLEHGVFIKEKDVDSPIRKELEGIARQRMAVEKKEKQAARAEERMRRKFMRLVREQERGDPDDETYRPMPAATVGGGGTKRKPTQIPKEPHRPRPVGPRSTANATGEAGARGTSRALTTSKSKRPKPVVEPSSESEASARMRLSAVSRRSMSVDPMSPDLGLDPLPDFTMTPPRVVLASPPRTVSSGTSGSDSDSDASSAAHRDKRAKIARRMLPAAMLRRLEQEAERKEREKHAAQKRADRRRSQSPVRPGRAIVRHGNGDGEGVEISEFLDMVADGPASSSQSPDPTPEQGFESDTSARERPIFVRSSSSEVSDSQAEEDHGFGGGGGGESLAQLYRGDFQSLVAGIGRLPRRQKANRLDRSHGLGMGGSKSKKHSHRPALGLKKQVRAPTSVSRSNRMMVQSRLDFPPEDRPTPVAKARGHKRPHVPTSARKGNDRPRPAIRLDDRTIFATDDFAFDDDDDAEIQQHTPRPAKRTGTGAGARTPSARVHEIETLDMGVGKARSWAYLDKLSVDFGITPLPSGLYCSSDSIPGSGRLARLVDIVLGEVDTSGIIIDPCAAYGVELYPSLTVPAIQAVIPIIFDKIYESTTARILSVEADGVDLSPLDFLGSYLASAPGELDELVESVWKGMSEITGRLDLLDLPLGKNGRDARQVILGLRWALFELAIYMTAKSTSKTELTDMAVPLFSHLLFTGFDKAIRPLKSILRGESDTAEISDPALTTWISALTTWISALHVLAQSSSDENAGLTCLAKALDSHYPHDQVGPLAAERIWYLVFGLCAVNQFDINGRTSSSYTPVPQWTLVRRAIGLIKISHNEEAEEGAHLHQLQGRDRYIKVMLARCIRLSSIWQWSFDRESFSIATRDLGTIFKDRQYRNLPTESPVDFPTFITSFDMTLTAAVDSKRESAFELYLRLVCVAASDLISASQSLTEAQQAEKDVQRLVMTIMPVSPVKFNRILPPTPRQLGQLINRYSTMVAATYFSPALLPWLLACSKKWVVFESADFDSRQVSIRGLMYVAVACRHHRQSTSLDLVVNRLAEILGLLQKELDQQAKGFVPVHAPSRLEVERTMVMVVSCVKQVILHHSFDPEQSEVTYPDPSLLHESWTTCVFALDLSKDLKCSTEVVATIQAFLDVRLKALPAKAKLAREEKVESQDEFGSLGFELDDTTLAQLGGGDQTADPTQKQDEQFATVLENVICPRIYRLLSDMLPAVTERPTSMSEDKVDFVAKLTKCFSDCAGILVIDHRRLDWSTFIGPFGKMSWSRIGDERGRLEVGLHFMLNVATTDPSAFSRHEDEFVALLLQALVTSKWGIEQEYIDTVLSIPRAGDYPLLTAIDPAHYESADRLMEHRGTVIEVILLNISDQLKSRLEWAASRKPLMYRCLNLLVSGMVSNDKSIYEARVLHKEEYRAFSSEVLTKMRRILGDGVVNPSVLPSLKYLL